MVTQTNASLVCVHLIRTQYVLLISCSSSLHPQNLEDGILLPVKSGINSGSKKSEGMTIVVVNVLIRMLFAMLIFLLK